MLTLNSVKTAADYPGLGDTGKATLGPVTPTRDNNAGYLNVQVYDASVLIQLYVLDDPSLGVRGYHPTNEILLPASATQSQIRSWQGVTGFTAKDSVAGTHGRLIADLSEPQDPIGTVGVPIGSGGNQIGGGVIAGAVNANGTVNRGTGFSSSRVSAGVYDVTYTTAFAATPIVLATPVASQQLFMVSNETTSGFRATFGPPADNQFNFTASASS